MKKSILIALTILLTASGFFYPFLPDQEALADEDGRIVKIESPSNKSGPEIVISPSELEIDKKIIVIWLNLIENKEINITFNDPEAVVSATSDPMGFTPEDNGGFSARYMPHIATASLRFIKSGVFSYTVTYPTDHQKTSTGKIIVR
jgi:hypothetical protein